MKYFFNRYELTAISLIEVLVTMSILIILIKVSLGYLNTLQIETRRQEAHSELIKLKSNIEQMAASGFVGQQRVNSALDVAEFLQDPAQTINSPNRYYIIRVSSVNRGSNQYTLTATAQGVQAERDPQCLKINLNVIAEQDDNRDPGMCWNAR